jgi:hypothetical protein
MKDERILTVQKWIKGEKPRTGKKRKRNPTRGMDVCVVFVV